MIAPKIPARFRRHNAFSLVEVALAVGIAGSALLVVFSLIPVGLSSLHDTARQIVEAEIYTKIGSELATTALYEAPQALETAPRTPVLQTFCSDLKRFPAYFDAEGNEIKRPAATANVIPAQAVYVVQCTYGDGTNAKPTVAVWSPASNGELLSATVSIGFHQNPGTAPVSSPNVRQRTFLLSNHGS